MAYSYGSVGVTNALIPLQGSVGITGGQYQITPSVGAQTYPYSPPILPGVSSTGTVSPMGIQALANPTHPTKGVIIPALIMFIAGVVILDLIFYRKH